MRRSLHLEEVPYCPDSGAHFERIRDLPDAAFLDSSFPHTGAGRHDIITADPVDAGLPEPPPVDSERAWRGFFDALCDFQEEYYAGFQPASQDIPFSGGILGFLGYDCGNGLQDVPVPAPTRLPRTRLRTYDWCLVQDHLLRRAVLVTQPETSPGRRADLLARLRGPATHGVQAFSLGARFTSNFSAEQYRAAFECVQGYIHAGDCYQVNLAQCFSAPYEGDPWHAYRGLRAAAAAPFSAYIAMDRGALLNLSPERFLSLHGHRVETSPIKGTRPRYSDRRTDNLAAQELSRSEKDRAENLMIVDLLRNDLGRGCVPGSIHVDRLFEVQSFPTVHHLVSTISGELREDGNAWSLLRDCFPGGSITGAPKRRAMQIIAELEGRPREAYCGSVLYVSADGRMDSNIAIRSLLCDGDRVHCWGGGGIVADSEWQREYQETYDKVGRFLEILERDVTD